MKQVAPHPAAETAESALPLGRRQLLSIFGPHYRFRIEPTIWCTLTDLGNLAGHPHQADGPITGIVPITIPIIYQPAEYNPPCAFAAFKSVLISSADYPVENCAIIADEMMKR